MSDHPIGSFEWAKQIVTDANTAWEAERMAMSKPIEGSPSLMEHVPRTRERAALDIVTKRLRAIEDKAISPASIFDDEHDFNWIAEQARLALRCIADLVPEADIHGEPLRNTGREP